MRKNIITLLLFGFSFSGVNGLLTSNSTCIFLSAPVTSLERISHDIHDNSSDFSSFYDDPTYAISAKHLFNTGFEFGFTYADALEDVNPLRLEFNYHFNNTILFGVYFDDLNDHLVKSIHSTYHDNDSFIDITYNLETDSKQLTFEIGQYWQFNSLLLGGSYTANLSDIHLGYISLMLGSSF